MTLIGVGALTAVRCRSHRALHVHVRRAATIRSAVRPLATTARVHPGANLYLAPL